MALGISFRRAMHMLILLVNEHEARKKIVVELGRDHGLGTSSSSSKTRGQQDPAPIRMRCLGSSATGLDLSETMAADSPPPRPGQNDDDDE